MLNRSIIFSTENCLFISLAHLSSGVTVFFLLSFMNTIHTKNIKHFLSKCVVNVVPFYLITTIIIFNSIYLN